MRQNPLRTLFAQKKLALNGWASIGNSFLAEVVADCGYDAVTVDLQHGLFSIESAVPMLQAISTTNAAPLVRCSENSLGEINKLLDAGAGVLYGGKDYFEHANRTVLTLAMIETRQGLAAVEEILSVPDLDGIFIGPSDLAIELGLTPDSWSDDKVDQAIKHLIEVSHARGKYVGIFCGSVEMAERMKAYGVDMLTPGTDVQLLRAET
ncbi:HpcH/HpaI aldolase family protein, partial [Herbaspirillum lusitanum]|uniref:HpcH/HpaI aldolase family protein n=1 Tax=Herbaspirillum lusitanum TaxID=213312 RepID=UPI00035E54BD